MSKKISIVKQIMNLLENRELTSIEIAKELKIPKGNCASYLTTLRKDGRIIKINDNIPYKYKLAKKPIELLKQLINFMSNKCEVKGEVSEIDSNLFKQIERVIK